ncbi:MAG: SCO family protein [Bacteroidota bacterium]|jgi:protein SCO1/2
MKKIGFFTYLLVFTSFLFLGLAIFYKLNDKPIKTLPIYGQKYFNGKDSVFHTVKAFKFINQNGDSISEKTFEGSIYVADYFFTTCQSICPIMSTQMQLVAKEFSENKKVKFLSHTVNPENDSVNVLYDYAKAHHANAEQWHFVTGDKKQLYNMARESYLLNAEIGDGGPNDFIHTQNFALIDTHKNIRGFYDGTDKKDVQRLIKDIKTLLKE